ncbi:MAG: hypothetical protein KDA96_01675 [Planctomycetaceae bacterium]|nr:hypothetical protein [Planctomycetaceae bacterium]
MASKQWPLTILAIAALAAHSVAGADEPSGTGSLAVNGDIAVNNDGLTNFESFASVSAIDEGPADADADSAKKYGLIYPWASHVTPFSQGAIARFGWWAASNSGSNVKINEFQNAGSSPFWDVDGIFSDGKRTVDFVGSQFDEDANSARLKIFDRRVQFNLEFDQYNRTLDHDPVFTSPGNVVSDDIHVGQDYAIRVQELKATAKGKVTDNVSWKLNMWGLRRSGNRQATAVAHCFDISTVDPLQAGNVCHVLSQRQRIDWVTMEIEPVLEAKFDNLAIEYSHTFRSMGQDDGIVTRSYTRPTWGFSGDYPYSYVSENDTQIDRVKISSEIADDTYLYSYLHYGVTDNHFRNVDREFGGADVRITNKSLDNTTITAYSKLLDSQNELPSTLLPEEGAGGDLRHPIDYQRFQAGMNFRWEPYKDDVFSDLHGLALTGGYEFYQLSRSYAVYSSSRLGTFAQPDTVRHQIDFGPTMKWNDNVDSFVRYRGRFTADPIIGVRESTGRFNTNQPEQEHGIDIGGTWRPRNNLMLMAQFSLVNSWNRSSYPSANPDNRPINFSEDSYPIITSFWWAPTRKLSFTGGYSYFSNWIDQDISQGFRFTNTDTSSWNYGGIAHVINANINYAYTSAVMLTSGVEHVNSNNAFSAPASTTGADWSAVPSFSAVDVTTTRLLTGVDYQFRPGMMAYFRYTLFDFDDTFASYNTGTTNLFLAGASATY